VTEPHPAAKTASLTVPLLITRAFFALEKALGGELNKMFTRSGIGACVNTHSYQQWPQRPFHRPLDGGTVTYITNSPMASPAMTQPPKKRQTKAERRSAILQAAGEAFFLQGYAATSIDSIIERLGGSKRAIYQEFGSKEGLLVAFVSEGANELLASLDSAYVEHHDLRETLIEFGCATTSALLSPGFIGAYRSALSEALRLPELAQAYYVNGPGKAQHRLAQVLNSAKNRGEIRLEDCDTAACHLLGMLRDNVHLRVVLGLSPRPSQKDIRKHVTSAVDLFLNGASASAPVAAGKPRLTAKTAKKK